MAQELISSRFARLFDDAFTTTETTRSSVPVDLAEWEDRFELQFDVPGVRSEDVSIEYQEGSLTISHESMRPLLSQSNNELAKSHSSGTPLPLQSELVPSAMSQSSGMPFWLQSRAKPSAISQAS